MVLKTGLREYLAYIKKISKPNIVANSKNVVIPNEETFKNRLTFYFYDQTELYIELDVAGNSEAFYTIESSIKILLDDDENRIMDVEIAEDSCTCPYFEQHGICKHLIAFWEQLSKGNFIVKAEEEIITLGTRYKLGEIFEGFTTSINYSKQKHSKKVAKKYQTLIISPDQPFYDFYPPDFELSSRHKNLTLTLEGFSNFLKGKSFEFYYTCNSGYVWEVAGSLRFTKVKDGFTIKVEQDAELKASLLFLESIIEVSSLSDLKELLEHKLSEFSKRYGIDLAEAPQHVFFCFYHPHVYKIPLSEKETAIDNLFFYEGRELPELPHFSEVGKQIRRQFEKKSLKLRQEQQVRNPIKKQQHAYAYLIRSYDSRDLVRGMAVLPMVGKASKAGLIASKISLITYIPHPELSSAISPFVSNSDSYNLLYRNRYNQQNKEKEVENMMKVSEHHADLLDFQFKIVNHALHEVQNYPVYWNTAPESETVTKAKIKEVQIAEGFLELQMQVEEDEKLNVNFFVKHPDFERPISFQDLITPSTETLPYFVLRNNKIYRFEKLDDGMQMLSLTAYPDNIQYPISEKLNVFQNFVLPVSAQILTNFQLKTPVKHFETGEAKEVSKVISISEADGLLYFEPYIDINGEITISIFDQNKFFLNSEDELLELNDDIGLMEQFEQWIIEQHPSFEEGIHNQILVLGVEDLFKRQWFHRFCDHAEKAGVTLLGEDIRKKYKFSTHAMKIKLGFESGIDWFDTKVEVRFGKEKISLSHLKKSILKNQQYVTLKDGSKGFIPEEWAQKLKKLFEFGKTSKDSVSLKKYQATVIDEFYDEIESEELKKELVDFKEKLANYKEIKKNPLPQNLNATLRPYQEEGYHWMHFLDEFQFGGCLADDMGLGKTLQVLSFLLQQSKEKAEANLVVVPNSLIFNWQAEVKKFTPQLNILVHHGPQRERHTDAFDAYEIILTTYGTMVADISFLKAYRYNYIILDESQAIKNPTAQRFKASRLLKSNNRLALTGTPIENNTFDLYAQMEFLNPGLLGTQASFKKQFAEAIDKNKDQEQADLLRQMIHPFILRRTKEQVAKELPPKTENILYCEMLPQQRKIYETYKDKYRAQLLEKIEEEGINNSKMHVLEALTKLRQICNSPALVKKENFGHFSAKTDLLMDFVKDKIKSHKILVFSQFTEMLALIRRTLEEKGVAYSYLDGKTKDREKVVAEFQEDPHKRIFLISLKAGGTGLNLTAADYVFLVDPWWNPAVENQAIDRTYRIGQSAHVFAYRMICKDSIEEKILKLQENKKQVSADIIHSEEGIMKQLDKEGIKKLFS